MTTEQMQTLAAHIRANTDPVIVAALAGRNDNAITDWYNTATTTKGWQTSVGREVLFGSLNLTTYDGLTAGKRDSFRLIFDSAPVDFTNDKIRAAIVDIFGAVDEAVMLSAGTVFINRVEEVFGGASATSGTVTAIKRNFVGTVSLNEVSVALNG